MFVRSGKTTGNGEDAFSWDNCDFVEVISDDFDQRQLQRRNLVLAVFRERLSRVRIDEAKELLPRLFPRDHYAVPLRWQERSCHRSFLQVSLRKVVFM